MLIGLHQVLVILPEAEAKISIILVQLCLIANRSIKNLGLMRAFTYPPLSRQNQKVPAGFLLQRTVQKHFKKSINNEDEQKINEQNPPATFDYFLLIVLNLKQMFTLFDINEVCLDLRTL